MQGPHYWNSFGCSRGHTWRERFRQVLQELKGRLVAMDLVQQNGATSHSGIHQSIAPRIGETRQIYATPLNSVKQYLFSEWYQQQPAMPENTFACSRRDLFFSPALNFSSLRLQRTNGFHVRRRVTINSWCK